MAAYDTHRRQHVLYTSGRRTRQALHCSTNHQQESIAFSRKSDIYSVVSSASKQTEASIPPAPRSLSHPPTPNILSPQSQYLIAPSNPAVATLLLSCGCHCAHTTGPSLAPILCHILHVFQSQKHTYPPLSPLITNCPSGLTLTSIA